MSIVQNLINAKLEHKVSVNEPVSSGKTFGDTNHLSPKDRALIYHKYLGRTKIRYYCALATLRANHKVLSAKIVSERLGFMYFTTTVECNSMSAINLKLGVLRREQRKKGDDLS